MSLFLNNIYQSKTSPIPIWFMRQAGRYLPEYRELRKKTSSFLEFCYHVDYAVEATLQPIERYNLDAAIIFSDILIIPDAIGAKVSFQENEGPVIEKINSQKLIDNLHLDNLVNHLAPVFQAIKNVRRSLDTDKALVGFCGAPWTIACYMVSGKNINNFYETRKMARSHPQTFQKLIDIITNAIIITAKEQIKAGADAIQIFDSWSGLLPADEFEKFTIKPMEKITSEIKKHYPKTPIIGFPRGAGLKIEDYVTSTKIDILQCDEMLNMSQLAKKMPNMVFQGNFDPMLLFADDAVIIQKIKQIISDMKNYKFIFNLGHGISKETNPEKVQLMIDTIRKFS